MKRTLLSVSCVLSIAVLILMSCGQNTSAPRTSLKTQVDSVSYAFGVNMADQGLVQYLEQIGVLVNSSYIESEYNSKIAAADSSQEEVLKKEMQVKLDSIARINTPRLKEFIKGFNSSIKLKENDAYAMGLNVGLQFSQQFIPQFEKMLVSIDSTQSINVSQVQAGLINDLMKHKLAISGADATTMLRNASDKAREIEQAKREENLKIQYADTIAKGKAFLEENGKREGVVTTASGLQYEILKKGNGPIPTDTDKVRVNYHGTLINGTVFDSSIERGKPEEFMVEGVIPGWTEALKLMPVGSKWRLYIPYDLAYGSRNTGKITPFSTLIFDVELLAIVSEH